MSYLCDFYAVGMPANSSAARRRAPSESAADRAYRFVKDRIVRGGYPGGALLSEGDVATEVAVSRTPVREAFLRLQSEGFLVLYPKRGALVVPVSLDEIHDVLQARQLVESHAADMVIRSGRHRAVAEEMRRILTRQRDRPGPEEFTELDREFHAHLVAAAGNQLIVDFYAALRDRQLRMGTAALSRDPDRVTTILAEHAALCDHLAEGDREAVAATVSGHLAATRSALAMPAAGATSDHAHRDR